MRSSKRDFEAFVEGTVWADMVETLEDWAAGLRERPFGEFPTREEKMDEFMRCEGRLEAINYLLGIPQSLINALEFEEESAHGSGHDETG